MTAPTHISFAALVYLVLLTSAGVPLTLLNATATALASLLPDIDTGASIAGRLFPSLSRRIERRCGHRTLTHSLPFSLAVAVCLAPLAFLDRGIYIVIMVGYVSHPLLDSCTVTGVRLLYPISGARCVFPMDVNVPSRYRITSGGRQEWVLCALFVLLCIPALLVAHQGFARFVRVAQGNIESAVRDYRDFSRSHAVWVECRAQSGFSKENLSGRYEVVGDLDAQTLLIKCPDGKLHTLGKEYRAEFVADDAVCTEGEHVMTRVEHFDMAGKRVSEIPSMGSVHLFGTLVIAGGALGSGARSSPLVIGEDSGRHPPPSPPTSDDAPISGPHAPFSPVAITGRELRLNYATPGDLAARRVDGYRVESGWVTVRTIVPGSVDAAHRPGEPHLFHESTRLRDEDELLFSCSVGDTVARGDTLAVWEAGGIVKREHRQVELAIGTLRARMECETRAFRAKAERLHGRVLADSIALRNAQRLHALGFLHATSPESGASGKSRLEEELLESERGARGAESTGRLYALASKERALRSRLIPLGGRRELLASGHGIVVSVERADQWLTYTIRAL